MEPTRLIVAPQLPVAMRYQEWWPHEIMAHLRDAFDEIVFLGWITDPVPASFEAFSVTQLAIKYELAMVERYLELAEKGFRPGDVLLHCDLSFPGIFHSVLAHKRPPRCAVFCHGTSRNAHDYFAANRTAKWSMEKGTARLYDKVFVATKYHEAKLGLPNVVCMGAFPNPPDRILPEKILPLYLDTASSTRYRTMVSVARNTIQKVDGAVECTLKQLTGVAINRAKLPTWKQYYTFLDHSRFLVITSREETYGYQVIDALLRGCIPIAPRAYSYPELLPDELLYEPGGPAVVRAARILEIMRREPKCPDRPLCWRHVEGFWSRLRVELTTW